MREALKKVGSLIQTAFDNDKEFINEVLGNAGFNPDTVFDLGNILVASHFVYITWTDYEGEFNSVYLNIEVLLDFYDKYGQDKVSELFSG